MSLFRRCRCRFVRDVNLHRGQVDLRVMCLPRVEKDGRLKGWCRRDLLYGKSEDEISLSLVLAIPIRPM
jgi:hypothetical protein